MYKNFDFLSISMYKLYISYESVNLTGYVLTLFCLYKMTTWTRILVTENEKEGKNSLWNVLLEGINIRRMQWHMDHAKNGKKNMVITQNERKARDSYIPNHGTHSKFQAEIK